MENDWMLRSELVLVAPDKDGVALQDEEPGVSISAQVGVNIPGAALVLIA